MLLWGEHWLRQRYLMLVLLYTMLEIEICDSVSFFSADLWNLNISLFYYIRTTLFTDGFVLGLIFRIFLAQIRPC